MAFFNPALLWFALGGSIPIIIHLLHRQKFRRVRWAAMEFLLAALKKTRRRLQIENLILLLLRILIMIILALAIARPFLREANALAPGESDTHYILVIDNSYSMGYKKAQVSSFDTARKAAQQVLEQIKPSDSDRFTLLLMSDYPERPMKMRNNLQLDQIKSALGDPTASSTDMYRIRPSHYGTDAYRTLMEIKEALNETKNVDRRIYIFTDMARNGWVSRDDKQNGKLQEALKELSHAPRTRFFMIDCGTPGAVNRAIVDLRVMDPVVTTKKTTEFAVDIYNFSNTPFEGVGVTLYIDDNFYQQKTTPLQAGVLRTVNFRYDFAEPGPHIVKASLAPDFLDVDDHRWLALDVKSAIKGLLIDGEPGRKKKLTATGTLAMVLDLFEDGRTGISVEVQPWNNLNLDKLDLFDFVVLADVEAVEPQKLEKIEEFVAKGGGLFISLGGKVLRQQFNAAFWKNGEGLSPASLGDVLGVPPSDERPLGIPRRLADFNYEHPMFKAFQTKETQAAVSDLVFYRYVKTDNYKPEHVVAYFDDGARGPLILEKKYKDGKVVLWTSTINDDKVDIWNNGLPGKPPYFAICRDLCVHLAGRPLSRRNYLIGEMIQITLPADMWQKTYLLEVPEEGKEKTVVTLNPTPPEKDAKVFELHYPSKESGEEPRLINRGLMHAGKYTLAKQAPGPNERPEAAYFACNLPPRSPSLEDLQLSEGNLDRIGTDEFKKLFPDFQVTFLGEKDEKQGQIEVAPPSSGLWKHLLYVLMAFLGMETLLGWLFGRAKQ